MRLLADESVDGPVVIRLRADGHEVAWVAEDAPGVTDDVVLLKGCQGCPASWLLAASGVRSA